MSKYRIAVRNYPNHTYYSPSCVNPIRPFIVRAVECKIAPMDLARLLQLRFPHMESSVERVMSYGVQYHLVLALDFWELHHKGWINVDA